MAYGTIHNINHKRHIRSIAPRGHRNRLPVPPVRSYSNFRDLEATQKELHEKIKTLMAEAEKISQKLQSHKITFTKDAKGFIAVNGLAEVPFVAHYQDWLRFFAEGNGAKLREFAAECAKGSAAKTSTAFGKPQ